MPYYRQTLLAYALRNPTVGYFQGANFMVALLLDVLQDATLALMGLAVICEDPAMFPDSFSPGLLGGKNCSPHFNCCLCPRLTHTSTLPLPSTYASTSSQFAATPR